MMNRLLFNGNFKWCIPSFSLYLYAGFCWYKRISCLKTTEKGSTAILAFHFLFSLSYLKYFA